MLWLIMIAGCYATYMDIRFRRIPNIVTWGLWSIGLVSQLGFWLLSRTELVSIATIVATGLGISYLLYIYGLWAPGDAKLFWAIAIALPPTLFYEQFYEHEVSFFSLNTPIWSLLVNAIVLSFVFLVFFLLIQKNRSIRNPSKETYTLHYWLYSGFELIGLNGLVLGIASLFLGRTLTFLEAAVAVIALYLLTDRFPHSGIPTFLGSSRLSPRRIQCTSASSLDFLPSIMDTHLEPPNGLCIDPCAL